MRPNKVGWFLVAFFAIAGFFFWRAIPEIFIGQIWMGVAGLLAVLYLVMTVRVNKASRLAMTGVRGHADILEMSQTGTYINNQPRVKMRLRIQAPGVIPFETEDTVTVPLIALGALQPGRPLTVVLDPADPKDFVIDWSGSSRYPGSAHAPSAAQPGSHMPGAPNVGAGVPGDDDPDPAVRLTKLAQLRDAGTITSAEFEEHKRRILSDI
ncbi:MAG: SHOCT domain-containing protein [Actinomycetota bacterium]|nr:SHOCT domain-containing protein [Actinomycetota bacterium]